MARSGVVGQEIDIGVKFFENGALFDPFSIDTTIVYNAASAGDVQTGAVPTRISVGFYQISWSIPKDQPAGDYFDEWTWIAEDGMASKVQRYSFEVIPGAIATQTESASGEEAAVAIAGCRERPKWVSLIGLRVAEDVGNGMGIRLTWAEAIPADPDKQVHYNIYYSSTRFGVFGGVPEAISTGRQGIVNVPPGNLQYLAVRATEFLATEFDITELPQISTDVYVYPGTDTLQNDIDGYESTIEVLDNSLYPSKGFLKIDSEIIKYTTKGTNTFAVTDSDRGAVQTFIESHDIGATIELWHGVEDDNSLILNETAAWHEVSGTPRNIDAIGELNVDDDGYREATTDIVTADFSISEARNEDFPGYDFKGYHRPSLQSTFSGDCVGSYVGGEFDGGRGFFFQDRNLARLDAMLQVTGEQVVLLRRKWSGQRCRCIGLRREHPRTRCAFCYGTGFTGGYDRYTNTRPISERFVNTQGMIMARIHPYSDDLESVADQGLRQPSELTAWTLTVPTLKDRDIIIRFNRTDSNAFIEEFRYEVLDVTRNKLFFGNTGKQEFRMRRHDKTDVIYTFDAVI